MLRNSLLLKILKTWNETESVLQRILRDAIGHISISEQQKLKYESSATEQEIEAGALNVPDAKEHVFCCLK